MGLFQTEKTAKTSAWFCLCECGKTTIVKSNNLKSKITQSCGCLQKSRAFSANIKDISGEIFGNLKVIKYEKTKSKNSYWLCLCLLCNNEKIISKSALKNGQKSCGCKQGWFRSEFPGLWKNGSQYSKHQRKDPIKKLRHKISGSIRGMIKHNGGYKRKKSIRNYLPYTIEELKLHLEKLWEPWMNWGNYGGKSNDKRKTWHIDHIMPHSSFKYQSMEDLEFIKCWSLNNLRPLEKFENMSKGNKILNI